MSAQSEKELQHSFGPQINSPDLLEKLKALLDIFALSVEDLYLHWETYCVSKAQKNLSLTVDNLDRLQEYIQLLIGGRSGGPEKRKPVFRNVLASSSPAHGTTPSTTSGSRSGNTPSTPSLKRKKMDETPPFKTPGEHFNSSPAPSDYGTANNTFLTPSDDKNTSSGSNTQSNTIMESLNPQIEPLEGYVELQEDESTSIKPFQVAANFDASKYKFRTMLMKLLESADVLDEQIDYFTQLYQKTHPETTFGNPCLLSQFPIVVCGRIVPDSPQYDASQTLNSTTLFLETSRFGGIGQRVCLDISKVPEYSLFVGQLVVLKGTNPTGRTFAVDQIMELPKLGASVTLGQELTEFHELTRNSGGLKVMIVAGPYLNQYTLDYSRLEKLVSRINDEIKPHTVVMFGPFVDINNISVANGDLEDEKKQIKSLDDLFKVYLAPIIKKINPRITVVMVPSLKDVNTRHCSYPQEGFNRKSMGLPKNCKVFPNPSSFSINEVLFGCLNLDVFKDLKDVYKGGKTTLSNRFQRISNHVFDQRRYYPVFPGAIQSKMPRAGEDSHEIIQKSNGFMGPELGQTGIGGASLEVPYLGLAELGDSLPDVLIIPSELKYFARVVNGVVVINPGYFIRPNKVPTKEDGSYVVMCVGSPNIEDERSVTPVGKDDLYYHNVCGRARVDIYKS